MIPHTIENPPSGNFRKTTPPGAGTRSFSTTRGRLSQRVPILSRSSRRPFPLAAASFARLLLKDMSK